MMMTAKKTECEVSSSFFDNERYRGKTFKELMVQVPKSKNHDFKEQVGDMKYSNRKACLAVEADT